MESKRLNKKAMEIEMIGWLIIAFGILVAMLIGYLTITGKLNNAIEYIKNALRFGI